jgi:hypothetical protein
MVLENLTLYVCLIDITLELTSTIGSQLTTEEYDRFCVPFSETWHEQFVHTCI